MINIDFDDLSSGIIWETRKSTTGRWRAMNNQEVFLVEEGYKKYLMELQVDKESAYRVALAPKFEVNFYLRSLF